MESSFPVPFPAEVALDKSRLQLNYRPDCALEEESDRASQYISYVPGYPHVALEPSQVLKFLRRELNTQVLDEMYHVLWLFSVKSGRNIDPLHRQRIKGREIVPTEEAKLHLVWTQDRIYIKTMPVCLLNHSFWNNFLRSGKGWKTISNSTTLADEGFDRGVALGFLRSYALLIQSPLDFALAREAHIIPHDANIDWISWAKFTVHFYGIQDGGVSRRYRFGQIRLNRLNWLLRIMQPRSSNSIWFYQRHTWTIGAMISASFPVLLFAFASLSLVLSSMQVALTVPNDGLDFAHLNAKNIVVVQRAFWVFALATIIISLLTWIYIILLPLGIFLLQVTWAIRTKGIANPVGRIKTSAIEEFAKV
ncbi:hypothetical protein QQS21_006665 [Conoideocrella luteorostrata]|uniref:Uncharacterized protein n=1 Tax=Conoideocrella luteorostrata TaxID=1105319 RepID=A0AAJ0FY28_9HYPO|nr:hypothetical protein QQS21_006665 [Conoideocrella luteorostrata]